MMPDLDMNLVVGADGLLGRGWAQHLRSAGRNVIETTRREGQPGAHRRLLDLEPDPADWPIPARDSTSD